MGWQTYGKDSHDTPIIIRLFGFGPSEGGEWSCRCGKTHTIVKIGDTLSWDWRIEQARKEIVDNPESRAFAAKQLADEWLKISEHQDSAADARTAIEFTLERLGVTEQPPQHKISGYRDLANDLLVTLHGEGHAEEELARPAEQLVRMLRQLDQWGYLSVTQVDVPKQG